MKWIGRHLNWTYGIALIVGLTAVIWAIISSSVTGGIIYLVVIYVGGYLVEWRKDNQITSKSPYLFLFPPLFAIVILCSHNNRRDKNKEKENNTKQSSIKDKQND